MDLWGVEKQPTSGGVNPYGEGASERIDYVFTRDGDDRSVRAVALRRVFDAPLEIGARSAAYSDHFGVLSELELGEDPRPAHISSSASLELARKLLARGRELTTQRERNQQLGAVGVAVASAMLWTATPNWTRRDWLRCCPDRTRVPGRRQQRSRLTCNHASGIPRRALGSAQ